jgi:hypothetical protein
MIPLTVFFKAQLRESLVVSNARGDNCLTARRRAGRKGESSITELENNME